MMKEERKSLKGGLSGPSSGRYKRKKNDRDERYDSGEDEPEQDKRESAESFIVILRFNDKAQEIMKKLNPLVLTYTLAKVIGDIQYAKVLGDGNLLVKCANGEQGEKALKVKELGKVKVVSSGRVGVRNGGGGKGVITGVHLSVDMEELKKHLRGGKIKNVQRMKATREGVKKDSETVLIEFDGQAIPKRVFLGFMSYPVRMYVPKPLRCFNCQRFGHIAQYCKEKRRCARCGGEHEYGKCGTGVQPKCCNCGGAHSVAYGGCEVMQRENKVQKVRVERGISYAEAVKVSREQNPEANERGVGLMGGQQVQQRAGNREGLYVEKRDLVTFIAGVINSTAEVKSKSEKIQLIVKAAVRHLGLAGLTWEEVRDNLTNQSSQESP